MSDKLLVLFLLLKLAASQPPSAAEFTYNGFRGANLSRNGVAEITSDGLLRLTNTTQQQIGRAFFPIPLQFKNSSNGNAHSFSTNFVFAILHDDPDLSGHGIAFLISPSTELPGALPSQYLGLFNSSNNGNSSNHVFAVELDTIQSTEFGDIDNNHVGIDINGLRSNESAPASYFSTDGELKNFSLASGKKTQVWIEYDGVGKQLNVTLYPIDVPKPNRPRLSVPVDLSSVIVEDGMFVGFSSSTGSMLTSHYILGWSFKMNGRAQALDLSRLGTLPRVGRSAKKRSMVMIVVFSLIAAGFLLAAIWGIVFTVRKIRFAEILEEWEIEYGPHRFSYKDLFMATKGFSDKELLGVGGFGRVYRGVLPKSEMEVAVKKISHESRQGMREFVAEIASIGRIRHLNLVRLLGYCRRKGELLLVYDFMPNGSLDRLLFQQPKSMLDWNQRFQIIKGVASGLLFLHEEWAQVVLHRDIKASNVLLDRELNGTLGDFGLARLYDHGTDPQTTHMVGTIGYIAPELTRTGKATTSTDVFAFGVFLLEVVCGRRPIEPKLSLDKLILVDWVWGCWKRGAIEEVVDSNLGSEFVGKELELVLKLGLVCSQPLASARPTMRQVVEYLNGGEAVGAFQLSLDCIKASVSEEVNNQAFVDMVMSSLSLPVEEDIG